MSDFNMPSSIDLSRMKETSRRDVVLIIVGVILIATIIGIASHYLGRGIGWFGGNLLAK